MEYKKLMHKIISVSLLHRYYIQQNASPTGLYAGQPPLLDYVKQHGACSQKDIAAALHVSPASIAVSIKRMEKNGLLSRTADAVDMRRNVVDITDAGLQALAGFDSLCSELDNRMFEGSSEDELQVFEKVLDTMTENLLQGRDEAEIMREIAAMREKEK